jgi:putative FmdB family regulatory protein
VPLYEFRCKACNHAFEQVCKTGTKENEITCPQCGKPEVRRRYSSFFACSKSSDSGSDFSNVMPSSGGSGCSTCGGGTCSTCH